MEVQSEYEKIQAEYQKLFENMQAQTSGDSPGGSSSELSQLKMELSEYEQKMHAKNRHVQKLEKELAQSTSSCDDIIDFQAKYETLQNEYNILSKMLDEKYLGTENNYEDAKVNALKMENDHLKSIESQYKDSQAELYRLRTEYSMLEQEYVKLVEESL